MISKDLVVHIVRLDGSRSTQHPRSVIDALCDSSGSIKFPFHLFNSSPQDVCVSNSVDRRDRGLMLADSGEFTVVETHGATAILIASVVLSVASAIYAYSSVRNIPDTADLGQSSNNSLAARTNKERPNQRIEDIAGQVQSIPTLIQLPYRKWVDNVEVEYSYMSVSVGSGVPVNAKDGDTNIEFMDGSGAQFYAPYTSPNTTLTPEYTFGESFSERVQIIRRSNEVDGGQVLDSISDLSLQLPGSSVNCQPATGAQAGRIDRGAGQDFEFDDFFDVGDLVTVDIDSAGTDLGGDYEVLAVDFDYIELIAPGGGGAETVNANWGLITGTDDNLGSGSIAPTNADVNFAGPFFLAGELNGFYLNLTANGLIADNGGRITIDSEIQYAQADDDGNMIGGWSVGILATISGQTRSKIGITTEIAVPFVGNILVRCRRITDRISGSQLQDITIDSLYSTRSIGNIDFGNVTTVQTRVLQSQRASQIKERRFNSLWQRKLPIIQPDGSIGAEAETSRFVDYFVYASLSDTIGRRQQWEINNQDLVSKYSEIVAYFGNDDAGEFNYTFDRDQTSYQDTADIIAKAAFSEAVRRLGVITFKFERPQSPSTIFSHRTKIPGQQTITRTFKGDAINDGVELTYIDPETNEEAVVYAPDNTAIRPRKIETQGVRSYAHAYWLAWRAYNRLRYQRITLNDTFTSEGQLLSVLDVAGVTDDTQVMPTGGEVVFVDGLLITLSQPVTFGSGSHSITLRRRDGSIQGIACTNPSASPTTINVMLSSAPSEPIYTGDEEVRTIFTFAEDSMANADVYIFGDIDRTNQQAISIEAVNYDERYYQNDTVNPLV